MLSVGLEANAIGKDAVEHGSRFCDVAGQPRGKIPVALSKTACPSFNRKGR
jgi:hypothetical protein